MALVLMDRFHVLNLRLGSGGVLRRRGRNWLASECRYEAGTAGYSFPGRCQPYAVFMPGRCGENEGKMDVLVFIYLFYMKRILEGFKRPKES